MVIIGIDPGSRTTGFGVIESKENQNIYLDSGCIRVTGNHSGIGLQQIFSRLQEIIQTYQPQEAAIEQIFMHQNANSALKLGQARGAAIVALNVPMAEYSARQVKQSVVGYGAAKKEQVQHMVRCLLNLKEIVATDASDALAIALCHAHTLFSLKKFNSQPLYNSKKRTRWRDYQPV